MVGHGALADPWIFTGREVDEASAASFLLEYSERLVASGASQKGSVKRVKQLIVQWTAGQLCEDRDSWLRERDHEALLARLRVLSKQ